MEPAAARRSLYERGNQGGVPRRANPDPRNSIRKSVLWEEDLFWKGGKLVRARGVCIFITKYVVTVGKGFSGKGYLQAIQ